MKTSTKNKLKGSLRVIKGQVEEKVGQVRNRPKLKAKGRVDQLAGKVQNKFGQIASKLAK